VTASEPMGTPVGASASRLLVSVGNAAFEPGRTEVALDSTGSVRIHQTLEGSDARRAEAKLDPEHATQMIRSAHQAVTTAREGKRYGLPDEPRYHFEVGEGEARRSFTLWRSELSENPELNRIVSTLQQLVHEHGKGEILL
jgi:hypothetical protein